MPSSPRRKGLSKFLQPGGAAVWSWKRTTWGGRLMLVNLTVHSLPLCTNLLGALLLPAPLGAEVREAAEAPAGAAGTTGGAAGASVAATGTLAKSPCSSYRKASSPNWRPSNAHWRLSSTCCNPSWSGTSPPIQDLSQNEPGCRRPPDEKQD